MTRFELYCMIYFALDSEWEESKSEELGNFLSSANPFLFKDIGSADPAIYKEYCEKIPEKIAPIESYEYAKKYIDFLANSVISDAFISMTKEEWDEALQEYLSHEHKGSN